MIESTMIKSAAMRTLSLALQLALIVFLRSTLAADDDPRNISGYDNTVWGMTEDEVLQAEPLAQRLDPPVKTTAGGIRAVTLKDIRIASDPFTAQFIFDFKDRKLMQVTLESPKPLLSSRIFSDIEKLLTEKYGSPTYKQQGKNVSWKLTKTTIELMFVNLPGWVQVFVIYRPVGASADASKNL